MLWRHCDDNAIKFIRRKLRTQSEAGFVRVQVGNTCLQLHFASQRDHTFGGRLGKELGQITTRKQQITFPPRLSKNRSQYLYKNFCAGVRDGSI